MKRFNQIILGILVLNFCFPGIICAQKGANYHRERLIITGVVVEIRHPIAIIHAEEDKIYRVRLGPYWYWKKAGFRLKKGDRVRIIAIKKGSLLFPIAIKSEEGAIQIRDESGIPLWRIKE
ncbi:hypothetical protein [Thermodesulfatator atlanticus]|uniref:hypothetical protein n=1 Tax=Thermodesulfatator atlanticus TaxID=501497 RepID=UPI0003B54FBE|nr:hypothetical protein [Thermodesulfatator atlanticus]